MCYVVSNKDRVLLLTSGGIDSTALIDFYLRRNLRVRCIYFQYGQPSAQSEKAAVERICAHYKVEKEIVTLEFPMARRKEEFVCRNILFVLAASSLELPPLRIALGIHAGSQYYDCTRSFLDDCQRILDGYYSGTVRVEAPFLDFIKIDIVEYCQANDVPLDFTYSCQRQNYPPCGKCKSCLDRRKFYGS